MGVDSYLELFTTMYGWSFSDIIRDVLIATGLIYLPRVVRSPGFRLVATWTTGAA